MHTLQKNHYQREKISRVRIMGIRYLVIGILVLTAFCGHALAHVPGDIGVFYNESSGDLDVTITHKVDNPTTHYVKHVTVRQGTTVLADQTYQSQPDNSVITYRYTLPIMKEYNGEITVDAECNVFGIRSETFALAGTSVAATTAANAPAGVNPALGMAPVCVFIALITSALMATRILR
ncbi:MAG: hypothetical protein LUQ54_04995 [Methanoregula sp.]|nr:hypothetical protein [Methanoregula sp.]